MTESLTDPERSRLYIFVSVSEFDILGDICFNTRGLELSAHRTSVRRSVSQMKNGAVMCAGLFHAFTIVKEGGFSVITARRMNYSVKARTFFPLDNT